LPIFLTDSPAACRATPCFCPDMSCGVPLRSARIANVQNEVGYRHESGDASKSGMNRTTRGRRVRVQEVIPVKQSKAYRSSSVKSVEVEKVLAPRGGQSVEVGLDIGKASIWAVVRFRDGTYLRPWRCANPSELSVMVELLTRMSRQVKLTVAMESSGTYGDPLRQALTDAGVKVHRVSSKATHDWAEAFDGVPSQHDGKDAAVVAELCAMGKSVAWPFKVQEELEQEMAYWVDQLDTSHRLHQLWCGRLESRLARHWPEAADVLRVSSRTLLKALLKWSSPAALGADPQAAATLRRLSYRCLKDPLIDRLVRDARSSMGVRTTSWDQRRIQEDAANALQVLRQKRQASRRLKELSAQHELIPALGPVVGVPTACVLWMCAGDPRNYASSAAYRKALGLNLTERSSGLYQGELRISKRGPAMARRFLYFAAMRHASKDPVKLWYREKKRRDGQEAMRGIVAVMRKLALAIHATARGEVFESSRLFKSLVNDNALSTALRR
jgi:transposase